MAHRFLAEPRPNAGRCAEIAALSPHNPFQSPAYAAARAAEGNEPWLLALRGEHGLATGCLGFVARGRLSSLLEIHSLPALPDPDPFWDGLRALCREQRLTDLQIGTFGSPHAAIPALGREVWRRARREYVLDLTLAEPWRALASNHKRNVKRARKAGVRVEVRTDPAAVETHARAVAGSMGRRKARGEAVSTEVDATPYRALVERGAGALHQALLDGTVVSSILVLGAAKGAYYHSAGSLPEGMAVGAAHFLIGSVAEGLRERGLERFNLGGADDPESGLARFKAGFGAAVVELEAARFALCSPMRRVFLAATRGLGRA